MTKTRKEKRVNTPDFHLIVNPMRPELVHTYIYAKYAVYEIGD